MVSDSNQNISQEEQERYIELQKMALDFAREGKTQDLRMMIDAGMPADLADEKGQTLLMLASYNGNFETTAMLLKKGATVDQKNDRGQTPLGGVAFKGYPEIAKLLIKNGADVFADNGGGMTPAHYASMFGRFETYELLISHQDKARMNHHKEFKKFALMPKIAGWIGSVRRWMNV